MQYIVNVLKGIVLALANIIPGVSGGTMAVVMGIYDRILAPLSLDFKAIRKDWRFLCALAAGVAVGLVAFAKLVSFLLQNHPMPTNFFFIGLILGSLPMIFRKAQTNQKGEKAGIKFRHVLIFAAALGVMILTTLLKPGEAAGLITSPTLLQVLLLFLSGVVAAVAMIIPGISGSFLLLVMGTYSSVIGAVSSFNFAVLLPAGLGIAAGLIFGARLVRFLMRACPQETYSAILGLVGGSIAAIYPGFSFDLTGLVSLLVLLAGAAIAWWMGHREG